MSLIEYILFFLVSIKVVSALRSRNTNKFAYILLSLSLVSGLFVTYSVQGHNYMAGTLSLSFLFLCLSFPNNNKKFFPFIFGLSIAISFWTSYQLILYAPSFIFTFLLFFVFTTSLYKPLKNRFRSFIIPILLSISTLYMLLLHRIPSTAGIGYNSGFSNEYIVNYSSIKSFLYYLILSLNHTIISLFLPPGFPSSIGSIFSGLLLIFILISISSTIYSLYSKNKLCLNPIYVSADVLLLNHFSLYLVGKLAISPTRHSLLLFLPIVISSSSGLSIVVNKYSNFTLQYLGLITKRILTQKQYLTYIYLSLMITFLVLVSTSWLSELPKKIDLLTTSLIDYVKDSNYIIYDNYFNYSFAIAPEIKDKFIELHPKANPIKNKNKLGPILLKSKNLDNLGHIVYITNSFLPEISPAEMDTQVKTLGCDTSSLSVIKSQSSTNIPDTVPIPIFYGGTNSLHIFKIECNPNQLGLP